MTPLSLFAPAKLNLFLAITGRRPDGFHDLVSLVVTLDFGDTLRVAPAESGFHLTCDDPAVPGDETNLVVKAARLFAAATGGRGGATFVLEKRIPTGAGLGGGSSDGVAALRGLNQLAGNPLEEAALRSLAAQLGSDCALFLAGGPVVMRGRGERTEPLASAAAQALQGRRVLVFKPHFPIATAWAYGRMAAEPGSYLPPSEAEARLQALVGALSAGGGAEEHLFNNMETVAFAKFLALPTLLERLREDFGLRPRMSGSGSACFALLPAPADAAAIAEAIRSAWGPTAFVIEARIDKSALTRL